jgi:hypothetical protein
MTHSTFIFCRTIAQSAAFTKDEEKYFECFREVKELYKLRHACFASLLISPLYLLTGRKVTNNTWDQARVLRVSNRMLLFLGYTKICTVFEGIRE